MHLPLGNDIIKKQEKLIDKTLIALKVTDRENLKWKKLNFSQNGLKDV